MARAAAIPQFTPPLVRAAIAAGADALFLEVHPRPDTAPFGWHNMLRLDGCEPSARAGAGVCARSCMT